MQRRRGFSKGCGALCLWVMSVAFHPVTWAQIPNETYDFSLTKGVVEFGRGHYEQAAELFEQAHRAVPNDAEAAEYLGQTWLRLKKYREAEVLFQQLTIDHVARAQSWLGLAISQSQLGKYHEALESLEHAQKLDPQNPLVYFYQGLVSHEMKSLYQSSALFSRAMALSPDLTPTVRYYTGMSYYERGSSITRKESWRLRLHLEGPIQNWRKPLARFCSSGLQFPREPSNGT